MTESEKPKRRERYSGTHPRKFHEKYKEQQPGKYAADVEKVLASGKTPAGMHRPIMVAEILQVLDPRPGDVAVDCTLGYGGHAAEILRRILPGGRLIGIDADPIELPKTEQRLRHPAGEQPLPEEALLVRRLNFAGISRLLSVEAPAGANLLLADLGLSSMQIDNPARGFTFKHDGPLDLRINPQRGQPASALLASLSVSALATLLTENADEPNAQALARVLVEATRRQPIVTTTRLAQVVREASSAKGQNADDSVRRVFQAIRIAVNDEFGALDAFLRQLPAALAPGGRVAILTFHSGEDRRVKHAFKAAREAGLFSEISHEVTRASAAELRANPRSSSAKLRWARKA